MGWCQVQARPLLAAVPAMAAVTSGGVTEPRASTSALPSIRRWKAQKKMLVLGAVRSFLCKSAMADICLLFFVVLEEKSGFGSKIAIRWLDME